VNADESQAQVESLQGRDTLRRDTLRIYFEDGRKMLEVTTATGARLVLGLPAEHPSPAFFSGWLVKDERQ